MDTVPKNKRYIIKRLLEIDPSLSVDELKGKTILELSKMKETQKIQSTEKIEPVEEPESEFEYRSVFDYLGLKN
jgi:hypothetical protein